MFPALRRDVKERFTDIEQFLDSTTALQERHVTIAKGLMFVQIYAVYEYAVNRVVSGAIELITTHNHEMRDVLPSLLTLFLDPELRSLHDAPRKKEWQKRVELFERACSRQLVDLSSDTMLPNDGSHYRYSHLVLIFEIFGIKRMPVPRRQHEQRIAEVVNHRNAIAHGRETPQDIGRRYTRLELKKAIQQMRGICMLWIRVFEAYCAEPDRHRR